jgi:hypothetical protein
MGDARYSGTPGRRTQRRVWSQGFRFQTRSLKAALAEICTSLADMLPQAHLVSRCEPRHENWSKTSCGRSTSSSTSGAAAIRRRTLRAAMPQQWGWQKAKSVAEFCAAIRENNNQAFSRKPSTCLMGRSSPVGETKGGAQPQHRVRSLRRPNAHYPIHYMAP